MSQIIRVCFSVTDADEPSAALDSFVKGIQPHELLDAIDIVRCLGKQIIKMLARFELCAMSASNCHTRQPRCTGDCLCIIINRPCIDFQSGPSWLTSATTKGQGELSREGVATVPAGRASSRVTLAAVEDQACIVQSG